MDNKFDGIINETFGFSDCCLSDPLFDNGKLILKAKIINILPGNSINKGEDGIYLNNLRLTFNSIKFSERNLYEYEGKIQNDINLKPNKVIDGPFEKNSEKLYCFNLEGVLEDPISWIQWKIICNELVLEVYHEGIDD